MSEQILITGGLGFVGRHLTKRLLSQGHYVTIVDNYHEGSGALDLSEWMPHLQPTIAEKVKLAVVDMDCREWFKKIYPRQYHRVFHLAAVVGGRLTIENDPLAVAQDLSIDAEFFHWLTKQTNKPKVYYFSSSAAYPIKCQGRWASSWGLEESLQNFEDEGGSQDEANYWLPDMTYGWSKLTGEFLARTAHQKYGLDITCFRPFSGYGEDQDDSYPFPSILKRVLKRDNPVVVWGSGNQMRDFIYIEDCIDGILHLGEKIHDGSAVNLCTGIGTSFNQLAALMWVKAWTVEDTKGIQVKNTSDKPEGVFKRIGSTRLQKQLGFEAKTSLENGIAKSIYYIEHAAKSTHSNPAL